jgi:hypothetical protein
MNLLPDNKLARQTYSHQILARTNKSGLETTIEQIKKDLYRISWAKKKPFKKTAFILLVHILKR